MCEEEISRDFNPFLPDLTLHDVEGLKSLKDSFFYASVIRYVEYVRSYKQQSYWQKDIAPCNSTKHNNTKISTIDNNGQEIFSEYSNSIPEIEILVNFAKYFRGNKCLYPTRTAAKNFSDNNLFNIEGVRSFSSILHAKFKDKEFMSHILNIDIGHLKRIRIDIKLTEKVQVERASYLNGNMVRAYKRTLTPTIKIKDWTGRIKHIETMATFIGTIDKTSIDKYWESLKQGADIRNSIKRFNTGKTRKQETTIVLGEGASGILAHELGHLFTNDDNGYFADGFSPNDIGKHVSSNSFSLIDGTHGCTLGSVKAGQLIEIPPVDNLPLIDKGRLNKFMLSAEKAFSMGQAPTGHERHEIGKRDLTRMTHTRIPTGNHSKKEIFQSVNNGIYIPMAQSGVSHDGIITIRAHEAFRIVNGVKEEKPLGRVHVNMPALHILGNISMIGNKRFVSNATCTAHGDKVLTRQSGPTLKIDKATILTS